MTESIQIVRWPKLLEGMEVGECEANEFLAYVQDTRDCHVTSTPEGENNGTLLKTQAVRNLVMHRLREGHDLPVACELIWSMIERELEPGTTWIWLRNQQELMF